jgi:hypothetical protein
MGFVDRLGLAQRVIPVITLGLVGVAVGNYVVTLGLSETHLRQFPAAPLQPGQGFAITYSYARPDLSPTEQLLVVLGLILTWALASMVILRPRRANPPPPTSPAP